MANVGRTQDLDPQGLGELPGPVRAKDVRLVLTVGALEHAHVLHQAQDLQGDGTLLMGTIDEGPDSGSAHRHVDFPEHLGAFAGVQQGNVLRSRYNDGTWEHGGGKKSRKTKSIHQSIRRVWREETKAPLKIYTKNWA